MQLANYKDNVVVVKDTSDATSYEVYQFPGDKAINKSIPTVVSKADKKLKLVNPNRLSPAELRKLVIQMAEEIVILNDNLDELNEVLYNQEYNDI